VTAPRHASEGSATDNALGRAMNALRMYQARAALEEIQRAQGADGNSGSLPDQTRGEHTATPNGVPAAPLRR
jgi:hypothetical protein